MSALCSCPGCTTKASWLVTATNAGDRTGKRFYTCSRHADPDDDRVPANAELGDEVGVFGSESLKLDGEEPAYTGEVEGFTDGTDRVALVMGPVGPVDPSGMREVPQERLRVIPDAE